MSGFLKVQVIMWFVFSVEFNDVIGEGHQHVSRGKTGLRRQRVGPPSRHVWTAVWCKEKTNLT